MEVVLTYTDANGIVFDKVFSFKRDAYNVDVGYRVNNTSSQNILVQQWGQLTQSVVKPTEESNMMMQLYRGAAYSTEQEKYKKYDAKIKFIANELNNPTPAPNMKRDANKTA